MWAASCLRQEAELFPATPDIIQACSVAEAAAAINDCAQSGTTIHAAVVDLGLGPRQPSGLGVIDLLENAGVPVAIWTDWAEGAKRLMFVYAAFSWYSPVALLPSPEDAARRFERLGMNTRHTDDQRQSGEISRLVVAAPLARGTPDTPWHLATSATRDAQNRDEFVAMVQRELGVAPEVITGAEEAELSFTGAASVLDLTGGPVLVADIGGGSTELVRGGDGPLRSFSMDVGCVRMTERHLHDDPPTPAQIAATVTDLRAAIAEAREHVPLDADATFIGVAGTVTTIAAIALGLERYDPEAIHGSTITAGQVADVTARLLAMTREQRAALPVMHPGRVDVIGGGALVLRTLLEEIGAPAVIASEHDILDGIALSIA